MAAMARFEIFSNPNKAATHAYYVDVQSNFVMLSTRWCIPLLHHRPAMLILAGVQALVTFCDRQYLMDTGNLLAVPASLLRHPNGRLSPDEQSIAESCIEFVLRGY